MTHRERIEQYLREGRTVSGGKGDSVAKATEQSQAAFNQTLQSAFKTTFGMNQGILQRLDTVFKGLVANPQGFTPTTMAALNTGNTERTAMDYQNATKAAQATEAARGGSGLPSGVNAQITGQLAAGAAQEEASGQRTIALANEQQRQANFWNALGGEERVAAAESPLGFGSEVSSGSNAVSNLSQAYTQSQGPGIGAVLGGLAGGALSTLAPGGAFAKPVANALNG